MIRVFYLGLSDRKNSRYRIFDNFDTNVHFGSAFYKNYTEHRNEGRKRNYISRFDYLRKRGNWEHDLKNLNKASYWSRWLTWNLPTLKSSIKFIEDKFGGNIKIISLI